jgi:hypothetical protein
MLRIPRIKGFNSSSVKFLVLPSSAIDAKKYGDVHSDVPDTWKVFMKVETRPRKDAGLKHVYLFRHKFRKNVAERCVEIRGQRSKVRWFLEKSEGWGSHFLFVFT